MEVLLENLIAYLFAIALLAGTLFYYLKTHNRKTSETREKIEKAKEFGLHEPVSLHPVVNQETCIGSSACVEACPEKDILGLVSGKATTINASRCVGHGACFHACPVMAITLCIGTEKRGVELPHVNQDFESNVSGLYIAGELGGMGLIKNAVEQGKQASDALAKKLNRNHNAQYDVIIIGAGPAGISATLNSVKNKLRYLTLEQDTIGGTVFSFPRAKVVMTSPMDLPLYGKVKLFETSKNELIELWITVLEKNSIKIHEQEKVESLRKEGDIFRVVTKKGEYTSAGVILAIGRRGSPRKLGVPGEQSEHVYYRLLEPELIKNKNILVVGGGDSAIESALLLADEGNRVVISYRSESFSRLKPKNLEKINDAIVNGKVSALFNTQVKEIKADSTVLIHSGDNSVSEIPSELVYIFVGGELPNEFLTKAGITITKKFGEAVLTHKN